MSKIKYQPTFEEIKAAEAYFKLPEYSGNLFINMAQFANYTNVSLNAHITLLEAKIKELEYDVRCNNERRMGADL